MLSARSVAGGGVPAWLVQAPAVTVTRSNTRSAVGVAPADASTSSKVAGGATVTVAEPVAAPLAATVPLNVSLRIATAVTSVVVQDSVTLPEVCGLQMGSGFGDACSFPVGFSSTPQAVVT